MSKFEKPSGLNLPLSRRPENGWLFGVCSGIADYFGWSTGLVRLVFFAALLAFNGLAVVAYLVLAFLMPRYSVRPHEFPAHAARSARQRMYRSSPISNGRF